MSGQGQGQALTKEQAIQMVQTWNNAKVDELRGGPPAEQATGMNKEQIDALEKALREAAEAERRVFGAMQEMGQAPNAARSTETLSATPAPSNARSDATSAAVGSDVQAETQRQRADVMSASSFGTTTQDRQGQGSVMDAGLAQENRQKGVTGNSEASRETPSAGQGAKPPSMDMAQKENSGVAEGAQKTQQGQEKGKTQDGSSPSLMEQRATLETHGLGKKSGPNLDAFRGRKAAAEEEGKGESKGGEAQAGASMGPKPGESNEEYRQRLMKEASGMQESNPRAFNVFQRGLTLSMNAGSIYGDKKKNKLEGEDQPGSEASQREKEAQAEQQQQRQLTQQAAQNAANQVSARLSSRMGAHQAVDGQRASHSGPTQSHGGQSPGGSGPGGGGGRGR